MKFSGKFMPIIAAGILLAGAVPVSPAAVPTVQAADTAEKPASAPLFTELDGKSCGNISRNDYSRWANVVNSYLYESGKDQFTRVEYNGGAVLIENYSGGKVTSSASIEPELPLFGGFFSGSDFNFLVYGQRNPEESNEVEIMRVVKYSKDWKRLSETSVFGANTSTPFRAGSLRMTEAGGKLYVYTCHEMYKYTDGLNHQANMTFVIDEKTMTVTDSQYAISNNTRGYVSHSFNQFICTDGEKIYRADHGDAHPRSMYVSMCSVGSTVTKVTSGYFLTIAGATGNNSTGANLGGMALTDSRCVLAGASVDQKAESVNFNGQRNIFISVFEKENLYSEKEYFITNYPEGSGTTVKTPVITRAGGDRLVVMWEEYAKSQYCTKAVALGADGNMIGEPVEIDVRLSDCQPIMCSDGYMRWYVGDSRNLRMYAIDPYDLTAASVDAELPLGDIDGNRAVDADDASRVLAEYALFSTKGTGKFTDEQKKCGDVNGDGVIDADDASMILAYYSYCSTNTGLIKMEKWKEEIFNKK